MWGFAKERILSASPEWQQSAPPIKCDTVGYRLSGFDYIGLLKIDIEDAETGLLKNADRWPLVRNLSIELHGPECEQALEQALQNYEYTKTTRGELIFCTGLRLKHTMASFD